MRETVVFCYECHEDVIHNSVFLRNDLEALAELVRLRGLNEDFKSDNRDKVGARIQLLHEVIEAGIQAVRNREA